jgi:hypothetical protein
VIDKFREKAGDEAAAKTLNYEGEGARPQGASE